LATLTEALKPPQRASISIPMPTIYLHRSRYTTSTDSTRTRVLLIARRIGLVATLTGSVPLVPSHGLPGLVVRTGYLTKLFGVAHGLSRHGRQPADAAGRGGDPRGAAAFETSSSAPRLHRRDPGMRHSSRRPAGSCRGRCSRKPSATCVRAQTQASTSRSRLRGWRRRLTRERTALRAPAATGLLQVCCRYAVPRERRPRRDQCARMAPRDVADPEAALHLRR